MPLWAYGIECDICKRTYISPEAHFEEVNSDFDLEKKHKDKIPILK